MISRYLLPVLLALVLAACGEDVAPPVDEQEAEVEDVEVDPREVDEREGEEEALAADVRREVHGPGERPAEEIYERHCKACHETGAARAPRVGDSAWWEDALDNRGIEGLLRTTIQGVRAMPRRGMCMSCTDDELEATIRWMLEESGVDPSP